MSIAIDLDKVTAVLVGDEWFEVGTSDDGRSSFDTDSYEFVEGDRTIVGGGSVPGVPSTGFVFRDANSGEHIAGPLTALHAVRFRR